MERGINPIRAKRDRERAKEAKRLAKEARRAERKRSGGGDAPEGDAVDPQVEGAPEAQGVNPAAENADNADKT